MSAAEGSAAGGTVPAVSGDVFGFVFTVRRWDSGRVTVHEHPAYRRPDGAVVWAPHREHWRDAPADVAGSFVPAGDAARAARLELDRMAAAVNLDAAAAR